MGLLSNTCRYTPLKCSLFSIFSCSSGVVVGLGSGIFLFDSNNRLLGIQERAMAHTGGQSATLCRHDQHDARRTERAEHRQRSSEGEGAEKFNNMTWQWHRYWRWHLHWHWHWRWRWRWRGRGRGRRRGPLDGIWEHGKERQQARNRRDYLTVLTSFVWAIMAFRFCVCYKRWAEKLVD